MINQYEILKFIKKERELNFYNFRLNKFASHEIEKGKKCYILSLPRFVYIL